MTKSAEEKYATFKVNETKICTKCKVRKKREGEFSKNKNTWDGKSVICKECDRTKQRNRLKTVWDL